MGRKTEEDPSFPEKKPKITNTKKVKYTRRKNSLK